MTSLTKRFQNDRDTGTEAKALCSTSSIPEQRLKLFVQNVGSWLQFRLAFVIIYLKNESHRNALCTFCLWLQFA
jgi:hypothetical protein